MDSSERPKKPKEAMRRLSDRQAASREHRLVIAITALSAAITGLTTALIAFRR
jgi:hypothetical protein